jgi:hypothetical protein
MWPRKGDSATKCTSIVNRLFHPISRFDAVVGNINSRYQKDLLWQAA